MSDPFADLTAAEVGARKERDWFVDRLEMQILRLGGTLEDFPHWRVKAETNPADHDDERWECACGYASSPEVVERHWRAHKDEPG